MIPMSIRLACLLVVISLSLAGCVDKEAAPPPVADATAGQPSEDTSQRRLFEDRLREIAATYESFGRVSAAARWAPAMCRARDLPTPEVVFSRSKDSDTHGQKLYSLFAKELTPLGDYVVKGQPGQVIVKESWVPEEVTDDGKPLEPVHRKIKVRQGDSVVEKEDLFLPYARKDGRLYHAKERGPLFIMFKMDPQTPGTDAGWVYGTVTADGRQVTSAGKVESCMKCHQEAPHDRLFGLPENK
jgi:hypothetical protein